MTYPPCNNPECTRQDHATGRARMDVETLERAGEALIRSGHTQTAIAGYAWALRLRAEIVGYAPNTDRDYWFRKWEEHWAEVPE